MAQIMKDGPKRVLSQTMDQPWKVSEAAPRMGDTAPASALSPKAPIRSISHGNFRAFGLGSVPPAKRATSVVEEMETKQRENMSRKLKDLQLSSGRSPQPKIEMPTIVDSRLARTAALSRTTLRRDSVSNYQAVTPAALSFKGGASPATPRFSLNGPELFPLRASQSLTSLNRVYDRGFSVFASDNFDSYSTENGLMENRTATGNALLRSSLSSSARAEFLADTPPVREIRPAEEKAVENAIDNIFNDRPIKAVSLTGDLQSVSDKHRSKQDGSLTSEIISPAAGPPLNLKTHPKPQIPTKPADLKAFTSKEGKAKITSVGHAEQNDSKAASSFPVPVAVATSTTRYNQILGDFNHRDSRSSVGVAKDISLIGDQQLETQEKTYHRAENNNADIYLRSHHLLEDDVNSQDTRSVPPKPSFNARLQVDVDKYDPVVPHTSDPEVSDFTTRASTRLGVVPGSRIGLPSNATPYFVSHQKVDSLLSDCNTVDSGIGRSEAAGSPGSHYQDSADELDNKGYAGWTAPTTDSFTGGRDNQQQLKRQTKKEFVSTAAISLSPRVTETSKVNSIEIKPTIKDTNVSTRQSYHQETHLPASKLRGTPEETSDHFQGTQRLSSVLSRSSHSSYPSSTNTNHPTSGSITLDSKVPVEAETSRPIRVSGKKHHREDVASVPSFDIQSNQKILSEHRKKATSNFETDFSESPHTSVSRYTRSRESDVTEIRRRAEDRKLRDLHESETKVRDEPQRSRIKSRLLEDSEGRNETRTDVTQSYALNKKNQDKFYHDPHRTGTGNDVRETPEVRSESKIFHDPRRTETRTHVRQTHEVKDELYVSRNPQLMEQTQSRQTFENSAGFEPRHQSTSTKMEEQIATHGDDGMMEMEVQLIKGLTGLGFCIEGGIDSPMGDRPITVKRLFKGESAAKGKLQPGDIILAINGKPMSNKSHYQAWNKLKSLPEGPINLTVGRRRPLPPGTLV